MRREMRREMRGLGQGGLEMGVRVEAMKMC